MSFNDQILSPEQNGPVKTTYPFQDEGDATHVLKEMPMVVANDYYSAPPLNSTSASLYFIGDEDLSLETNILTFTRRYSSIPASRIEWETYAYTFPGVAWISPNPGRKPFPKTVPCAVTYDYFLVGSGSGYASAADIPINESQTYRYAGASMDTDSSDFFLTPTSTPSSTTYFAMTGSSLVVEPSTLRRYEGNIYERTTKKVKAY